MSSGERRAWNLVDDVRQLLSYHFMLNALRAGTIVAVVSGAIGYFMVLRRQSFVGHTLAVIGFPGAAGATWLGVSAAVRATSASASPVRWSSPHCPALGGPPAVGGARRGVRRRRHRAGLSRWRADFCSSACTRDSCPG